MKGFVHSFARTLPQTPALFPARTKNYLCIVLGHIGANLYVARIHLVRLDIVAGPSHSVFGGNLLLSLQQT